MEGGSITTGTGRPTSSDARDRAVGALVGLAVGDAVGTALEFRAPGTFTPIDDMVGGGPFGLEPGQWTDDTSMAMCLAESILDIGELDLADQLRRYLAWRDHGHWSSTGRCFDIGTTTSAALDHFQRTGRPVSTGPVDQDQAANGSLMRLAPVPIRWHTDPAEAAERSGESSRSTHPADRPVDACRVYGAMIAALIGGNDIDEVLAPDFWDLGPLHPQIEAVARGSWRSGDVRGTGYVVDALGAALWAVAGAVDFRDAVLRAANLGDDADTTAAIAGQLAGARWGLAGMPEPWVGRITSGERIAAIAGPGPLRGASPGARAGQGDGAVDNVGGAVLHWMLATMQQAGTVASIGNAASFDLNTSVFPFILRGVSLLGVDSGYIGFPTRQQVWNRLATDLRPRHLAQVARSIGFDALPGAFDDFIAGRIRGRTVVCIDA